MAFIITFLCAFIILWIIFKLMRKRPLDGLPGPKRWPIVGNLFQLQSTNVYLQLTDWAKEHGPIYGLDFAGQPALVVSGKDALEEVMLSRGNDYAGRPQTIRFTAPFNNGTMTLVANPSPRWRKTKKILMTHIHAYGSGFKNIEKVILQEMEDLVSTLTSTCGDGNKIVRLDENLIRSVINISCLLIFGHDIGKKDKQEVSLWNKRWIEILDINFKGTLLDVFPWLRFCGHPYGKLIKLIQLQYDQLYTGWKKRILDDKKTAKDTSGNILNRLYEILDGDNDVGFTENDGLNLIFPALGGAISTTSSTLRILMAQLVLNPSVQNALQEECDRTLGGRPVTVGDRASMPLHHATILEVTRMFPVGPLTVHRTQCDTKISTYAVPKDTLVIVNIWALLHDEQLWNDPQCFNPNRFIDEVGKLVAADHPTRKHHLAFGAGPRVCAGESLATARMFMILATMIQHFDILPATTLEDQPPCGCFDLVDGVILSPQPYSVRLKPRRAVTYVSLNV